MQHCSIKSLLKETLKYKPQLIRGNLATILATLLTVTIPLFIPLLVDEVILHKSDTLTGWVERNILPMSVEGYILFFLVVVVVLRLVGFLLNIYQVKMFLSVSKDIAYRLRSRAIEHLKMVSLKEYETSSASAIASKLVTDINTIDSFIGTTVSKLIVSTLTLIFTAVVLLLIEWKLALFILLTNPIVILFTVKVARGVGKLKALENVAVERFQSKLVSTIDLFREIKASNSQKLFFEKIEIEARNLKESSIEYGFKSDRAMRGSFLIFLSGYELFRSVAILVVYYGDLSVGLMLALFGYLWIMMTPTQDLIGFAYALSSAKASCKRVNSIFEMEQEPRVKGGSNPFEAEETLSLEAKNISFSYNPKQKILENINLKIEPKSKVAVVGPSGSGKTTLANLLVGFYPPDSGEILYNGVESKSIPLETVRKNIYLILQTPKLFDDTLEFNLTLGRKYSAKEIKRAVEIAQLSEVVESLKDGLQSRVGVDGVKLSGGQRQRVAIARMVLIDPKMVILDESTSALNVHTEINLFKALEEYLKPKTVVIIAHRLSTIEKSEFIYVLEEGKITDAGTPEELFAKERGYFSQMI